MSQRNAGLSPALLGVLLVLSAAGVYLEGIPSKIYGPFFGACGIVLVLLLWKRPLGPRVARLSLVVISIGLTVAAADLGLRRLTVQQLYYRPDDRYLCRWPPVPTLVRYEPNVVFQGRTHGDLAAMSGKSELREERDLHFATDGRGFRNTGPLPSEPLDILLLGDSFGVGTGTSQESTWGALLEARWGYPTYNLSAPGGPWNELMNLKAELHRLPTQAGTVVLWAIFGGNDLDDGYPEGLELPEPSGPLERFAVSFRSFRRHSPLRRLTRRFSTSRETVLERTLPDGAGFLFLDLYVKRHSRSLAEVLEHPNHDALQRVFAEMRRLASEERLEVAVVFLPGKAEVYAPLLDGSGTWTEAREPSAFATAVQTLCERQRFSFLDLTPHLIEAARSRFPRGEYLWWRDDSHWNVAGHQVAAEVVMEKLLRGLLGSRAEE